MGEVFAQALSYVFSIEGILFMALGVFIGIVFGAIPGLSGGLAIIILLPISYSMEAMNAIVMLIGCYCGGQYGGSISAILIGTPGTVEAAATVYDGHPLAKKGYPNRSLLMALTASFIGGTVAAVLLLVTAPFISKYAVQLGAPEYFSVALLGLAIIAGVCGKSAFSGFISAGLGMLLSTIGIDTITGVQRYTFNNLNLLSGLPLLPLLLGVFAMTDVYKSLQKKSAETNFNTVYESKPDDKLNWGLFKKCIAVICKSSLIGSIIGAIPGAGAAIAAFLGYSEAKRVSKTPMEFGNGMLEGIAAPESANNAVAASSFIPLLTLGIPGSVVAATLIGALNMHGVAPGPLMMTTQGDIYYGIILAFIVVQFIMYLEGRVFIKAFKNLIKVPNVLLMPCLIVFCLAGAYVYQYRTFDILAFIVIGTLFYVLFKFGATGAPFVLGYILGPTIEFNLAGSLVISKGSWTIFFTRPVSLILIIVSIVLYIVMYVQNKKCNKMIAEQLKEKANELGEEL